MIWLISGALLLVGIGVLIGFVFLAIVMNDLRAGVEEFKTSVVELTESTERLRLDSRTRIGKLQEKTGDSREVRGLRRMGASTRARRVVVGGSPDSQQRVALERQLGDMPDPGEEVNQP